ncbi:MAG: HlyC/CorC family transporter [Caldilineaceae bacterium]|nr:HlyC/CorC family transporter [Caldilineaceae bacterium]
MLQLVIAILIVLVTSGLCSGTEAALFSVPMIRVHQMVQTEQRFASSLLAIRENMSRPIATIVILNNIANIVGSITIGILAADVLGQHWLGIFSGVLTFLVIIFAEIIPKTLGEQYAEKIALVASRPVQILTLLFTPIVWTIEQITRPFTRGKTFPTTDESEIKLLTQIGLQEGIIEQDESDMILRVFRLNDVTAADIMTPRVSITSLNSEWTLAAAKEIIIASPHSRLILTGESPDDVHGFVLKNELLSAIVQEREAEPLRTFTREITFVPQNVNADKLLVTFQKSHQHLAIVIDEFGGVAGVVSLEDVLETLTGAIVDETDKIPDLRAAARRRSRSRLYPPGASEIRPEN